MEPSEQPKASKRSLLKSTFLLTFFTLAIVVLSSLGTYWYLSSRATINPLTQSQSTLTPVVSPSKKDTNNLKAIVEKRVLQFYARYQQFEIHPNNAWIQELYKEGYLTQSAAYQLETVTSYDPALCTQGESSSPIIIDAITLGEGNNMAVVLVKQYYEGSKTNNYITLTMDMKDLRITSLACNL